MRGSRRVSVEGPEQVAGAQEFTTLRVAPVSLHPLQAPTVTAGSVRVPAGQTVESVRVRAWAFSQVTVPVSPEGQAPEAGAHWVPVSVEGPGQGAHVLAVVAQVPLEVTAQEVHNVAVGSPQGSLLGLPFSSGQNHERVRASLGVRA